MTLWHELQAGLSRCMRQLLGHRQELAVLRALAVSSRSGTFGRRRRRRAAEQHLEHPLAAEHRRRAVAVRRQRQDAAVAEQAAPRVVGIRDLAELRPAHAGDAVVPRQPLVDERVVGGQQLEHRPIGAHEVVEEQLRLARHRLGERLVVVRERQRVGLDLVAGPAAGATATAKRVASASDAGRRASAGPGARRPPGRDSSPRRAGSISSRSGIVPQRKNESRDARSTSLIR